MIAVDTNILVHAHRRDSTFHTQSKRAISDLSGSTRTWAIPLHCLVEFCGIVTHGGIWKVPSTPGQATEQVIAWRECPTLTILGDHDRTLARLLELVTEANIIGAKVHDARIAALCLSHGVTELWTIDRDFSRFPALRTKNPLQNVS